MQQRISWIAGRAILTQKNSSVDQRDAIALQEPLPGKATIQSSVDSTSYSRDFTRFPVEQAHSYWTPSTSPLHKESHGPQAPAKPISQARALQ